MCPHKRTLHFWFRELCLFFDHTSLLQFIRSKVSIRSLEVEKIINESGNAISKVKFGTDNIFVKLFFIFLSIRRGFPPGMTY